MGLLRIINSMPNDMQLTPIDTSSKVQFGILGQTKKIRIQTFCFLLSSDRISIRLLVGLIMGQPMIGNMFERKVYAENGSCKSYLDEEESVLNLLCDCLLLQRTQNELTSKAQFS